MHDPMTVAFEIRRPWRDRPSKFFPDGYRPTVVTIWHRDPEQGGDDDSCGWSYPNISEGDRRLARELAEWEAKWPHYFNQPQRVPNPEYPSLWEVGPGDGLALVLAAWATFAWRLEHKQPSPKLVARALVAAANPHDNFNQLLTAADEESYYNAFCLLLRSYRRATRPWWRHPRWHVRHWRIQVHPVQSFKRWAFSRCCRCGKGFRYGEAPTTDQWDSQGPRWFRSERGIYHSGHCGADRTDQPCATTSGAP